MKRAFRMALVAGMGMAACSYGLAAGQIPAGATGQCKDGTYSMTATRQGACRGHQGIKDWYVVDPAAAAKTPSMPAPTAGGKSSAMPAPIAGAKTSSMPAPSAGGAVAAKPVPTVTKQVSTMPAPAAGGKAAALPVPAAGSPPAAMPAPAKGAGSASLPAPVAAAPVGGSGQVWVNLGTKVYHCPGSHFYGTTKDGKYMSEADAKAMGARADHNRPCVK
ncbi:DUF3761 domain-containing protein [soil metagenome]